MKKILAIFVAIGLIFAGGRFMATEAAGPINWDELPDETLPIPEN